MLLIIYIDFVVETVWKRFRLTDKFEEQFFISFVEGRILFIRIITEIVASGQK